MCFYGRFLLSINSLQHFDIDKIQFQQFLPKNSESIFLFYVLFVCVYAQHVCGSQAMTIRRQLSSTSVGLGLKPRTSALVVKRLYSLSYVAGPISFFKKYFLGWEDSSVFMDTCCSSRGPKFSSHTHRGQRTLPSPSALGAVLVSVS